MKIYSKDGTISQIKKEVVFINIALIIILGFTVYINSLKGEFIWDDLLLVKDNTYIKSWTKLPNVFTEDIGAGAASKYNFYRPLQMLTYMVDYSFWKLNVTGYHLTNIILHILVALCIYWLIYILYKDRLLSFLTSIFFLVHPIHTEAVSYISGRADPLAVLFMLLCLILYIKGLTLNNTRLHILILLSYTLALLTKEYSLSLLALLLLYHYAFEKKFRMRIILPILSITFLYILVRMTMLKFSTSDTLHPLNLFQRVPGFFVAITNYLRLLILPFNLHMGYGEKLFSLGDPKAISGIAILFSLLIYAFIKRKSDRLLFFSVSWFFIVLLPFSNLYPLNAYMAEHWLYLPSIGFFLILADKLCFIYRIKRLKVVTLLFIIGLLAFYSYLTIRQNDTWKESIAFYNRTLKYNPYDRKIHDNLGNAYASIGKHEEAIVSFKKAIELDPNFADVYYNLGNAYKSVGKYEDAIALYKKALQLEPNFVYAYNNLGNIYASIGKYDDAIALYKKVLQINPNYADAYYNLGNVYANNGKHKEAIASFKKALQINPNLADAYYNLGNLSKAIGKHKEAIALYKMAIEINPRFAMAHNNLAVVYYYEKQYELAIQHYDKAIELGHKGDPKFLELLKPYLKYKR